jgi:hypothetical protein
MSEPADLPTSVPCEFRDPKQEHVPQERLSEDRASASWACRSCGTALDRGESGGFRAVPDRRHLARDYRLRP